MSRPFRSAIQPSWSRRPMIRFMGWPRGFGRAISQRRIVWLPNSAPVRSGLTATTSSMLPCPLAVINSRVGGAKWVMKCWSSTQKSRQCARRCRPRAGCLFSSKLPPFAKNAKGWGTRNYFHLLEGRAGTPVLHGLSRGDSYFQGFASAWWFRGRPIGGTQIGIGGCGFRSPPGAMRCQASR